MMDSTGSVRLNARERESPASMGLVQAFAMIGEDLDDAALCNPIVRALLRHALHFGAQSDQSRDLVVDALKVFASDRVGLLAGAIRIVRESQELSDSLDLESKIAGMADEAQAPHRFVIVGAPIAVGSRCRRKQAHALVVADRRNLHSCPVSKRTDREWLHRSTP